MATFSENQVNEIIQRSNELARINGSGVNQKIFTQGIKEILSDKKSFSGVVALGNGNMLRVSHKPSGAVTLSMSDENGKAIGKLDRIHVGKPGAGQTPTGEAPDELSRLLTQAGAKPDKNLREQLSTAIEQSRKAELAGFEAGQKQLVYLSTGKRIEIICKDGKVSADLVDQDRRTKLADSIAHGKPEAVEKNNGKDNSLLAPGKGEDKQQTIEQVIDQTSEKLRDKGVNVSSATRSEIFDKLQHVTREAQQFKDNKKEVGLPDGRKISLESKEGKVIVTLVDKSGKVSSPIFNGAGNAIKLPEGKKAQAPGQENSMDASNDLLFVHRGGKFSNIRKAYIDSRNKQAETIKNRGPVAIKEREYLKASSRITKEMIADLNQSRLVPDKIKGSPNELKEFQSKLKETMNEYRKELAGKLKTGDRVNTPDLARFLKDKGYNVTIKKDFDRNLYYGVSETKSGELFANTYSIGENATTTQMLEKFGKGSGLGIKDGAVSLGNNLTKGVKNLGGAMGL